MERAPDTRRRRRTARHVRRRRITALGRAGRRGSSGAQRSRSRAYTVAAVLFALVAIGALALAFASKSAITVPEIDNVESDVALSFAFAFPGADDAPLERPVGVVAADGRIYVVDSAAGVVRVYDDRGIERDVIGEGVLGVPVYAAVDAERGVLYVTDRSKEALFLFGLDDGALVGTLAPSVPEGSAIATSWAPLAVDVAETGTLVVSDVLARHRVLLLEPGGRIIREIGGVQAAVDATGVAVALDFPNAVRATNDEVWVADSNNKRALVFGCDAVFRRIVPTGGLVRGFDFVPPLEDTTETTLVAFVDTLGSGLFLMDTNGASHGRFGGQDSAEGALAFPNDVSVDAERGRLYVADTGNRRIQVWDVVASSDAGGYTSMLGRTRDRQVARWIAALAGLLCVFATVRAIRTSSAGTDDAWVQSE